MGIQEIKDFGEWLLNFIPPKPKVVDKVLESFKKKIKKIYEKRDSLFKICKHQKMVMLDMCVLDVLLLSKRRYR